MISGFATRSEMCSCNSHGAELHAFSFVRSVLGRQGGDGARVGAHALSRLTLALRQGKNLTNSVLLHDLGATFYLILSSHSGFLFLIWGIKVWKRPTFRFRISTLPTQRVQPLLGVQCLRCFASRGEHVWSPICVLISVDGSCCVPFQ